MAENYVVNYDINVRSQKGLESIRKFQEATTKLDQCGQKLMAFQKKLDSVNAKFNQMAKKAPVFDVSTAKANQKLDRVISKLERIHSLAKKTAALNVSATAPTSRTTNKTGKSGQTTVVGGGSKGRRTTPSAPASTRRPAQSRIPGNISYRTLGPTMIDSGGIGAFNMVKGMGIAYGIAGLGSLMGNVVRDATEYDNLMQTAKNILHTHDKRPNFNRRFLDMAQTVRNVGVETKFTAPQVADAAKFLAMAGFNIEEINKSIRPIADIALVGDSDLGTTADVVTNIMTGYRIKADNMRQAADVMTMTFTKSNTTLMEIAEAYKYSSSLLSAANVPFEVATGALGILGDAGIKGSQAGTTMRTITANLVNPTKKQSKQWDELGIHRFDQNGQLRPLLEIFKDLQNANVNVDVFYKMFHRTAAQGAVALTNGVDKWNEIVMQNFLSDGLSKKLADEKKNTVQGLWYQLTSMFTENGMRAFEDIQNPIKDFLRQTIDWLKTSEAETTIKSLSSSLFELVQMLKDVAIRSVDFFNKFSFIIKPWLKFQVYAWPVLSIFRAFKAFFTSGMYLVSFAGKVSFLTGKLVALTRTLFGLKAINGLGALNNLFIGNYLSGSRGVSPEVMARYRRMNPISFGKGAGLIGGGLIGGFVGSKIGEAAGGDTGMWIGGMAGSLLGGAGGAALTSLFSNPVGWSILAAAAIGGVAYYFYQYHKKIDECTIANNKFLASSQAINGINISEHATTTDKYLSIVYNRQLDANRALGEYIQLRREELGLMESAEKKLEEQSPFKETHKQIYENASKAFGTWASVDEKYAAAVSPIYDKSGNLDIGMFVREQQNLNQFGKGYTSLQFNNVDFGDSQNTRSYSQIAAARLLYGLGRDTGVGSKARDVIDSFHQRIMTSESANDFYAVIKDLNSYVLGLQHTPGSQYWSMFQIGENSLEENQKGYHFVSALQGTLFDQFRWNNPTTAEANLLATLQKMLSLFDQQQPISNELLEKFLLQSGIDIFNESRYGKFGSDEFLKHFGYYNNQWNAGEYSFLNKDTGQIEKVNVTADEARKAFLLFHQNIVDTVNQLSPKIAPYFDSYIHSSVWNLENKKSPKSGDKEWINGKYSEYTFNSPTGKYEWVPLKDQPKLLDGNGNPIGGKTSGGATGADQSKYKSHYNSGSAAPKQVIVKIENLMNVESIDLKNSDNAAAIDNIKGQLTQALIDVVHDFDDSFHG